ncbi:MAG: hypothetical protein IAF58_16915 [Leptolyngbya sp.]|nr:hypothetical protein [Candidatus Melainabacteria bacterium]
MAKIVEGEINNSRSAANALQDVLDMGFFETSTIKIASTDHAVEGSIYVSKGSAIKGAALVETMENGRDAKGYAALRKLLGLKQAYFQYETGGDHTLAIESEGLNVDISLLIEHMPNLPAEAPSQFKSNETIPPNAKQRFDIPDAAELKGLSKPVVEKADPDKVVRGEKRMRKLAKRDMLFKGPVALALMLVMIAGVWHYFGDQIMAGLQPHSKASAAKHKQNKRAH